MSKIGDWIIELDEKKPEWQRRLEDYQDLGAIAPFYDEHYMSPSDVEEAEREADRIFSLWDYERCFGKVEKRGGESVR